MCGGGARGLRALWGGPVGGCGELWVWVPFVWLLRLWVPDSGCCLAGIFLIGGVSTN